MTSITSGAEEEQVDKVRAFDISEADPDRHILVLEATARSESSEKEKLKDEMRSSKGNSRKKGKQISGFKALFNVL